MMSRTCIGVPIEVEVPSIFMGDAVKLVGTGTGFPTIEPKRVGILWVIGKNWERASPQPKLGAGSSPGTVSRWAEKSRPVRAKEKSAKCRLEN